MSNASIFRFCTSRVCPHRLSRGSAPRPRTEPSLASRVSLCVCSACVEWCVMNDISMTKAKTLDTAIGASQFVGSADTPPLKLERTVFVDTCARASCAARLSVSL